MPIEIREITIKTEIVSQNATRIDVNKEQEIQALRRELLEECKRMVAEQQRKNTYKR